MTGIARGSKRGLRKEGVNMGRQDGKWLSGPGSQGMVPHGNNFWEELAQGFHEGNPLGCHFSLFHHHVQSIFCAVGRWSADCCYWHFVPAFFPFGRALSTSILGTAVNSLPLGVDGTISRCLTKDIFNFFKFRQIV